MCSCLLVRDDRHASAVMIYGSSKEPIYGQPILDQFYSLEKENKMCGLMREGCPLGVHLCNKAVQGWWNAESAGHPVKEAAWDKCWCFCVCCTMTLFFIWNLYIPSIWFILYQGHFQVVLPYCLYFSNILAILFDRTARNSPGEEGKLKCNLGCF